MPNRLIKFRPMSGIAGTAALVVLALVTTPARGQSGQWPQFRGPGGLGRAPAGNLPDAWIDSDYRWTLQLPGQGVGSPVVFDGRVYLLNAVAEQKQRTVICLDLASGEVLWREEFPLDPHPLHNRNTFASSTPYVDASGVYVAWADPARVSLVALTHDGQTRWNRDLGTWQSQHGFGTSPVILEGKLILLNSQQGEQLKPGERAGVSRMMALDPATGKSLWETPLTTTMACYGVPVLRTTPDGQRQIVGATTGDGLFGLDWNSGRMLWKSTVFRARCVSSPLVVGDLVIGTSGSGGGGNHLVAVRPPRDASTSAGDVKAGTEVYRIERAAPYVPTAAVAGERLVMVDDSGIASAVDAATGRILWSRRLGGNFSASPVIIGDKVLMIDLNGRAHVLALGDTFEPLGKFDLGGAVQATPAWADGSLLLRVGNAIRCLGTDAT